MNQHALSIVVLAGGHSAERSVSLRSGQAVMQALQSLGHQVDWFDPAEQAFSELSAKPYDFAFIALHGRGGEDGSIQGYLQHIGLPYSGSGVMACALAMDKHRTKALWRGLGLPTASSRLIVKGQEPQDYEQVLQQLGGKVMVKPSHEGSSIGMSVASSAGELQKAVQVAVEFDSHVLVEQWLSGPEYTIGLLGKTALPSIRVQVPKGFYDYQAKYESNSTEYICPAGLTDIQEMALRRLAEKAFMAVGGAAWGRVDLMLDEQGQPQLLEVNMVPGMTEKSLVPMAAKQQGYSFDDLVGRIVEQSRDIER